MSVASAVPNSAYPPAPRGAVTLRDVFLFSIYGMAALAAAMLAFGEGAAFPAVLTVPLAAAAVVVNERQRRIRLRGVWVNGLGLLALIVSIAEFLGPSVEARLLSGAHFLVYLTWIVLFQDKQLRQYWWIGAFALLQVSVGAVLTNSGAYGFLLLAFLLVTLWTLALANLYQRAGEFGALPREGAGPRDVAGAHEHARVTAAPNDSRSAPTMQTTLRPAVQQDVPGRWIPPRFVAGILGLSLAGILFGLLIFLLVPRFWIGRGAVFSAQEDQNASPITGYSSEIRLGQLGQILEDTSLAFSVRLVDRDTDQPVDLFEFSRAMGYEDPLFRGTVLDTYREGRWSRSTTAERYGLLPSAPRNEGLVRQEYRLGEYDYGVYFALRPADLGAVIKPSAAIRREIGTNTLYPSDLPRGRQEYYIWSRRAPHADLPDLLTGLRGRGAPDLASLYTLPPEGTPRLRELAGRLAAAIEGDQHQSRQRKLADALLRHLRDSGEFSYSLDMSVADPAIDPVEDFLFNRKSGHCEYFATALALLLRSTGVPARLVTGFKGADPTGEQGEYHVQQRHAHAWVEAWIDRRWEVLDPTPPAREEMVRLIAQRQGFWRTARESLANFWSDYVVTLSLDRQREALYDPLQSVWNLVRSGLQPVIDAARGFMDLTLSREGWQSGWAPAAFAGMALAWVVATGLLEFWRARTARTARGARRGVLGRLARLWRGLGRRTGSAEFAVAFYQRFLEIMGEQGLQPRAAQTAREFALVVTDALLPRLAPPGLAALPHDLTEGYYAARFGGRPLPPVRLAALEDQLQRLERLLKQQPPGQP